MTFCHLRFHPLRTKGKHAALYTKSVTATINLNVAMAYRFLADM